MTTNPAEPGPHDEPHTPASPDPDQVRTDIPGVDPDWPQTAEEMGEPNESVEG